MNEPNSTNFVTIEITEFNDEDDLLEQIKKAKEGLTNTEVSLGYDTTPGYYSDEAGIRVYIEVSGRRPFTESELFEIELQKQNQKRFNMEYDLKQLRVIKQRNPELFKEI